MLDRDSILRRLPPLPDRDQVLLIDGIRHAADIAAVGYNRLTTLLTDMVVPEASPQVGSNLEWQIPAAFLDAWAVVEALERIRGLLELYPHKRSIPSVPGLRAVFEANGLVRNMGAHVATSVPALRKHKNTALGVLSWCTLQSLQRPLVCMVYAGTFSNDKVWAVPTNPLGRSFRPPTDHIRLRAGKHTVELSEAMGLVRQRLAIFEQEVAALVTDLGMTGQTVGGDMLIVMPIECDGARWVSQEAASNTLGAGDPSE